jgi:hypothetical protein
MKRGKGKGFNPWFWLGLIEDDPQVRGLALKAG